MEPERLSNGYREYLLEDVDGLGRIVALAETGLAVEVIKKVLPCTHAHDGGEVAVYACPAARRELERQLEVIEKRVATLMDSARAITRALDALEPIPARRMA